MPDFTSALYLNFKHPTHQLNPWKSFTTGKPSVLFEPQIAQQLGKKIANLQGLENGTLGASTLHLFLDFFDFLAKREPIIFKDQYLYAVGEWGLNQAKAKKVPVLPFSGTNIQALKILIKKNLKSFQLPVIVSDGWCLQCGKPAPLNAYLKLLSPYNGLLIIDDTQALGILGKFSTEQMPYGTGGGGVLPYLNIRGKNIVSISSLAKAFGVPAAILSGNERLVSIFKKESNTRLHSSPLSNADLAAVNNAIQLNKFQGDNYRMQLWQRVYHLKKALLKIGIHSKGGIFPMQIIDQFDRNSTIALFKKLKESGVECLLIQTKQGNPAIAFLLNNSHQKKEIDWIRNSLASAKWKIEYG